MEVVMAFVIGFLFMAAVYLILSKSVLRVIIGTGLLSHGAHLLILTMGGFKNDAPPVLTDMAKNMADPLPQALILTAIVISFGVTAFFLVLAYRAYQELGTDHMDEIRGKLSDD